MADNLPDSVFPNNWFSTHKNFGQPGTFFIYPMKAFSRQQEVNPQIIADFGKNYKNVIRVLPTQEGESLEGTGSLIFDEQNKKIYCCLSERASLDTLNNFMKKLNDFSEKPYHLITFNAVDSKGIPIYHTNCILSILNKHTVCCLDTIKDKKERDFVEKEL